MYSANGPGTVRPPVVVDDETAMATFVVDSTLSVIQTLQPVPTFAPDPSSADPAYPLPVGVPIVAIPAHPLVDAE